MVQASEDVNALLSNILLRAVSFRLGKRGTPHNMALKAFAPRVAHLDRFHQRCAGHAGRLTRCYVADGI